MFRNFATKNSSDSGFRGSKDLRKRIWIIYFWRLLGCPYRSLVVKLVYNLLTRTCKLLTKYEAAHPTHRETRKLPRFPHYCSAFPDCRSPKVMGIPSKYGIFIPTFGCSFNGNLGGGFKYFVFFTPIWGRFPIWQIFFKWVETTT